MRNPLKLPLNFARLIAARVVLFCLRNKVVWGVHVGGRISASHPAFSSRWAFILANPVTGKPAGTRLVPTPAAYFVDYDDQARLPPRIWDLCYVATSNKSKNWDKFFEVASQFCEGNPDARVLAIFSPLNRAQQEANGKLFRESVPENIRSQFTIVNSIPNWPEKGLPYPILRELLKQVRVFALFSKLEGTSKLLVEALVSGCVVLCYKELQHKSGEVLPTIFDSEFDTLEMEEGNELETLVEANARATEDWAKRSIAANQLRFDPIAMRTTLQQRLTEIIGAEVALFSTENLHLRLPAHFRSAVREPLLLKYSTGDMVGVLDWWALLLKVRGRGAVEHETFSRSTY